MNKFLTKLSISFFNFIYKMQNKNHENKMKKLKKVLSANCAGQKIHTSSAATLSIKANYENEKKANQQKIEKIVSMYLSEPEKLFKYIENNKTPVHLTKLAPKILSFINEDEGFILPKKGLYALYLNLILNKKISFKTSEMFVLSSYNVNMYAFIYQFYNWYCFKNKINGYEVETQENFKHVFEICETSKINNLSYEEILGLKSAIRRDIEAIDFVKQVAIKTSISKKNLEKIKQGQKIRV